MWHKWFTDEKSIFPLKKLLMKFFNANWSVTTIDDVTNGTKFISKTCDDGVEKVFMWNRSAHYWSDFAMMVRM